MARTKGTRDALGARAELDSGRHGRVAYYRLERLREAGLADPSRFPFSIKILLEAVLRAENGREVTRDDVLRLAAYDPQRVQPIEVPFLPARVLLQDFTGVPCLVDLAAMRGALARLGGDPALVDPLCPVDLVIDHSVQVDVYGTKDAVARNAELEMERNRERYAFLRWGQQAFRNLRVIPPRSGICHQVNLEHLATVVGQRDEDGAAVAFPDTLVGTDSHTTMVNGLGVLGWGVGGIEAEAVMLGQPLALSAPPVVGFKLVGALRAGVTATDLVLTITEKLRGWGVVGKIVEFYGPGLSGMSVPDRATISNMAPEYGATAGFFPVDAQTLAYLQATGRSAGQVELVERYCRAQGLFRTDEMPDPLFQETVELDLSLVEPCLAGPKRPQDRVPLGEMKTRWQAGLGAPRQQRGFALDERARAACVPVRLAGGATAELGHGHVVIAALTSCTNTSNPSVMLAAGLLAKKAVQAGLRTKPWVKTSLAPGSLVVTDYLDAAGLTPYLERLGFATVGYGCTTCIGNSGPLPEAVERAVEEGGLVAVAVLSGNRNFEGRIHPQVRASFLASPPLVVAYALAGTVDRDLTSEPLGLADDGRPVYLAEIWPRPEEVAALLEMVQADGFRRRYAGIEQANPQWEQLPVVGGTLYDWQEASTYIREPPFFTAMPPAPGPIQEIRNARVLVLAGDSVTTDHISPAGAIARDSPAGRYLQQAGVEPAEFNTYGARRGNDEVMSRGTFANVRFRNLLVPDVEGGVTVHHPSGEQMSIFAAAQRYREEGTPTLVLAGEDYGMGSSRDWAAKGPHLLGVAAVIARSFERIHRSNLIGMGILPLQWPAGASTDTLGLNGRETFTIRIGDDLQPGQDVALEVVDEAGQHRTLAALCRIDSPLELEYYRNGGILQTVLRRLLQGSAAPATAVPPVAVR